MRKPWKMGKKQNMTFWYFGTLRIKQRDWDSLTGIQDSLRPSRKRWLIQTSWRRRQTAVADSGHFKQARTFQIWQIVIEEKNPFGPLFLWIVFLLKICLSQKGAEKSEIGSFDEIIFYSPRLPLEQQASALNDWREKLLKGWPKASILQLWE